jgi:site-specific DNA recombinase
MIAKSITKAAGYLRRSTDKQEMSLPDQRREIERYASENGYRIVRWFVDDGISGDDTAKRKGFQAMHTAACAKHRDFDVILVWDIDRFGRFDSMEAGYWVHPLREAGIRLASVTEGLTDWNSFTGRVIYSLKAEGKHQFLVSLSENVVRGGVNNADRGFVNGGSTPYGLDKMLVDEAGNHRQRVRDGEQFAKPRGWHIVYVPSDDPEKIRIVRWIFDTYANQDIGLRQLADLLNRSGVQGPTGKGWWTGTLQKMLRSPVYTGDLRWGLRSAGKYNRVAGKKAVAREGEKGYRYNPRDSLAGKDNAHEAIVDRVTFDRVQEKMTKRQVATHSHKGNNRERYVLSGILYCGNCGEKMYGRRKVRTWKGKTHETWMYCCTTYAMKGTAACSYNHIDDDLILGFLIRKLRDAVAAVGTDADALRERVRVHVVKQATIDPAEIEAKRTRLATMDTELSTGTKRLLRAPDDIADLLARELASLRRERDALAEQLATMETAGRQDVEQLVDESVARLMELGTLLNQTDPHSLREIIRRVVKRIDLHYEHTKRGKRTLCRMTKGRIELQHDPLSFSLVSPGTQLLLDQLRQFPTAEHDDGPDALEMALRLASEMLASSVPPDNLGSRLPVG